MGTACSFPQSVRELPGSNRRVVDACLRRFQADYAKAMARLQERRLGGQAARACAVYFRQALPEAAGKRVLDVA